MKLIARMDVRDRLKESEKQLSQNISSVRDMLGERGIKPEELPTAEDIKKIERRVKSEEKKIANKVGNYPNKARWKLQTAKEVIFSNYKKNCKCRRI